MGSENDIVKYMPNSFHETALHEKLSSLSIKNLLCVDTSVRAAKALGYSVALISDACTAKDLIFREANRVKNSV